MQGEIDGPRMQFNSPAAASPARCQMPAADPMYQPLLALFHLRLHREKMPALNMRIDFAPRKVHLRTVPGSIELRPFHWRWNIS
jgi:hypothetical protein